MNACDFNAFTYDGECYCCECLPDGVGPDDPEVYPIFADSEWDCFPVCDSCGYEHDYVSLTDVGQTWLTERDGPQDDDLTTEDFCTFYQVGLRRVVLTVEDDQDWREVVRQWQEEQQYWGNVWSISDHGNVELLSLSE